LGDLFGVNQKFVLLILELEKEEKTLLRNKFPLEGSCICETQKLENRVSHIFLIGSFLEFCKNMRKSIMGREFRIYIYVGGNKTETLQKLKD
jgi:hypothetical protein